MGILGTLQVYVGLFHVAVYGGGLLQTTGLCGYTGYTTGLAVYATHWVHYRSM